MPLPRIKMLPILFAVVFFALILDGPSARAVTGEAALESISWGDSAEKVRKVLADRRITSELLDAKAPQALSRALLRSGLLETLNRLGIEGTFRPDAQGPKADRFLFFVDQERTYILLFTGSSGFGTSNETTSGLYQVYVRAPVPVDTRIGGAANPFRQDRLRPLRRELKALADRFGIRPLRRDRKGNAFAFRGTRSDTRVSALYVPARDVVRIVYERS